MRQDAIEELRARGREPDPPLVPARPQGGTSEQGIRPVQVRPPVPEALLAEVVGHPAMPDRFKPLVKALGPGVRWGPRSGNKLTHPDAEAVALQGPSAELSTMRMDRQDLDPLGRQLGPIRQLTLRGRQGEPLAGHRPSILEPGEADVGAPHPGQFCQPTRHPFCIGVCLENPQEPMVSAPVRLEAELFLHLEVLGLEPKSAAPQWTPMGSG